MLFFQSRLPLPRATPHHSSSFAHRVPVAGTPRPHAGAFSEAPTSRAERPCGAHAKRPRKIPISPTSNAPSRGVAVHRWAFILGRLPALPAKMRQIAMKPLPGRYPPTLRAGRRTSRQQSTPAHPYDAPVPAHPYGTPMPDPLRPPSVRALPMAKKHGCERICNFPGMICQLKSIVYTSPSKPPSF